MFAILPPVDGPEGDSKLTRELLLSEAACLPDFLYKAQHMLLQLQT